MPDSALKTQPPLQTEYRGYSVSIRWYPAWAMTPAGWVCQLRKTEGDVDAKPTRLGRFPTSEQALQKGQEWVDAKEAESSQSPE